jgi:hypothetical protein
MVKVETAVAIGQAATLLTLATGFLLLRPEQLLVIWLPLSLATGCFVMWWDHGVAHNHGGPLNLPIITLLSLNWPSTLTIWFLRTSR